VTTERRLAKVEASLSPKEAVLRWLAEAQQYPSLVDHARSIVDLPVSAAPLTRIGESVEAAVRDAMKGAARATIEAAVRRAVGDAVFLFVLVMKLNTAALELARLEGLRAAALSLWVGALLGGPPVGDREARESDLEQGRERLAAWRRWHGVLDSIVTEVGAEEDARAALERRYFDGQSVLFADAAEAWTGLREHVDLLTALAERFPEVLRASTSSDDEPEVGGSSQSLTDLAASRARTLADDARVTAFEVLGDRPRAVAIMERRLRTKP